MEVIWSPLALEKVRDIAEYIALDNDIAAKQWVNDIFDKAENIGEFPEIGRLVPELSNMSYREIIFGNYRIIYSVLTEVKILTVRNCRQLLSSEDI
jgi:plasmid stabilization system protein ParE